MIICITGMPGAGKSEVAEMLEKKGFHVLEMRKVVEDMMAEEGIENTTKNLEEYATRIRKERGMDVVAVELEKKIERHPYKNLVISGMRSMYEFMYLKKYLKGMIIVAVIAPGKVRFERLKERKNNRIRYYKTFLYRERKTKKYGMRNAIKHAHYLIYNEGSMTELKKNVDFMLASMKADA